MSSHAFLLKVVALAPWLSDQTECKVTKLMALELLKVEATINDTVCLLVVGMLVVGRSNMDAVTKSKYIQALRTKSAQNMMEASGERLGAIPLRPSAAVLAQWGKSVMTMADKLMDMLMAAQTEAMLALSTGLERSCPRWGAFVTEAVVTDELARMQLVDNAAIGLLPKQTRELGDSMNTLRLMAEVFQMRQPVAELPGTRDAMRLCQNSFSFAKRTVTVAAAAKILFDDNARADSVEMVLNFRQSLPAGLLSRLEEKKALLTDGAPKGNIKRKASSASLGSVAPVGSLPPVKREKTGDIDTTASDTT